jgi:hypothetical protein
MCYRSVCKEFYVSDLTGYLDMSLTSGTNEMTPELIVLLY